MSCDKCEFWKQTIERLQNIEMDFENAKAKWERTKDNVISTLEMVCTDKYAGPQGMKHIEKKVHELMADCIKALKQ